MCNNNNNNIIAQIFLDQIASDAVFQFLNCQAFIYPLYNNLAKGVIRS
jgi:hypothetical protein